MRINEILQESEIDNEVFIILSNFINETTKVIGVFDVKYEVQGASKTITEATEFLKASSPSFYIEYFAEHNHKIKSLLDRLHVLRDRLQHKIDTGL